LLAEAIEALPLYVAHQSDSKSASEIALRYLKQYLFKEAIETLLRSPPVKDSKSASEIALRYLKQ
jgi:hypothetical protein